MLLLLLLFLAIKQLATHCVHCKCLHFYCYRFFWSNVNCCSSMSVHVSVSTFDISEYLGNLHITWSFYPLCLLTIQQSRPIFGQNTQLGRILFNTAIWPRKRSAQLLGSSRIIVVYMFDFLLMVLSINMRSSCNEFRPKISRIGRFTLKWLTCEYCFQNLPAKICAELF